MKLSIFVLGGWLLASVNTAQACDLCSVFTAERAQGESQLGFHGGLFEQYTHFGTLKDEGAKIEDPAGQSLDSSITQVFFAYSVNDRLTTQLNLPVVLRSFKRLADGGGLESGTENGLGDTTLVAKYRLYEVMSEQGNLSFYALGGLKLPTGNPERLSEELGDTEIEGSGVHGHDLALGSGSFDPIAGFTFSSRLNRFTLGAAAQAALRTTGRYGYRFGNDFIWSAAPGYYVALEHNYSATVALGASGELKANDSLNGEHAHDSAMTSVFVGPQLAFTMSDRFAASAALDVPVLTRNAAIQLVPDSRLRASFTMQF